MQHCPLNFALASFGTRMHSPPEAERILRVLASLPLTNSHTGIAAQITPYTNQQRGAVRGSTTNPPIRRRSSAM